MMYESDVIVQPAVNPAKAHDRRYHQLSFNQLNPGPGGMIDIASTVKNFQSFESSLNENKSFTNAKNFVPLIQR